MSSSPVIHASSIDADARTQYSTASSRYRDPIRREAYLSRLAEVEGTPDIKVVTGVRRCGKSKLLEAFARDVRERDPSANVIQVNFNLAEFEPLMEWRALHEHIEARYAEGAASATSPRETNTTWPTIHSATRSWERATWATGASTRTWSPSSS